VSEATTANQAAPNKNTAQDQAYASADAGVELSNSPPLAGRKASGGGKGLALLALLVGAVGAGTGGWGLWQLHALDSREQQQLNELQAVRSDAQEVARAGASLSARLNQLPTPAELEGRSQLLSQLQGDQQLLNQRLETVLGASRQDWRLAEAEHLLRLASLRLSALQDIPSATALVTAADEILHEQDDPAAFAAREQVAKALLALRSTDNPDREGLFLQLAALREQTAALNALAPSFSGEGGVLRELADEGGADPQWWQRALSTLAQYFRIDFSADENIRPLLAGQELGQVRLALSLALEQAQWAALHGQSEIYQQALQQTREVLSVHFATENSNSGALISQVDELLKRPVQVVPPNLNPALNAVQAYIQAKLEARIKQAEPTAASEAAAGGEQ
jgi:uncharacterized protein HemX